LARLTIVPLPDRDDPDPHRLLFASSSGTTPLATSHEV